MEGTAAKYGADILRFDCGLNEMQQVIETNERRKETFADPIEGLCVTTCTFRFIDV